MFVFVIGKDGVASLRAVEVGEWYQDYWIIKQGLHPGELVVAEGVNRVAEGAAVQIVSSSKPSEKQGTP
jgi:multidrug efflux pump subunit AcrA (membrane-fusion protein)